MCAEHQRFEVRFRFGVEQEDARDMRSALHDPASTDADVADEYEIAHS